MLEKAKSSHVHISFLSFALTHTFSGFLQGKALSDNRNFIDVLLGLVHLIRPLQLDFLFLKHFEINLFPYYLFLVQRGR